MNVHPILPKTLLSIPSFTLGLDSCAGDTITASSQAASSTASGRVAIWFLGLFLSNKRLLRERPLMAFP